MSYFLLFVFLLYGGMHYYAYRKIAVAVMLAPWMSACLILFMATMVLAPVIIRLTEKAGLESPATILSYAGYSWMGLLFLFFCTSVVIDFYRLLLHLAGLFPGRDFSPLALSDRNHLLVAVSCAVVISIYGYFDALNIRTERVIVKSDKIPAGVGRLTVVQVSDVHLGLIVGKERLGRIVKEIKRVKPDILVSTGDLVDSQIDDLGTLVDEMKGISSKYGMFAVTGNHEYYAGISQALDFTRKAGFAVLSGDSRAVAGIRIAGVDDPVAYRMGTGRKDEETNALGSSANGEFTLLLKHRPDVEKDSVGSFDLQLSGHIHKGQIFPFSMVTRLLYPVASGLTNLPGGGYLYVSRGTGTWGPPIRFLAPPEVTIIELVRPDTTGAVKQANISR
ncbi:MAG: metallophosphoesterase [Geobacteraceae bacterium]|nr:metallophosphoesterase [Geobacteraceae bacterium]